MIADSGAIDVGASTLDDIFAANPQDRTTGASRNVKAFTETRFDGQLGFSSGFGSRVTISAPGDNIESLFLIGAGYNATATEIAGGTSASAPEVAAAAAVALQVARLTGHPFATATQVRDALVATGTPVANPPQADTAIAVGPQVSVRRTVERLLADAGKTVQPGIARVAVHGRRSGSFIAEANERWVNDGTYVTALDPSYIKLDGPYTRADHLSGIWFPGSDTGADFNSYVTIAPDWEAVPANATYRLTVAGQPGRVIATAPFVRMLPAQLFAAAGVPLTPGVSRTISFTYSASVGLHAVAEATFQLTFGPPPQSSRLVLAPVVPAVASGTTIPVSYDLRGYPANLIGAPVLNVSLPGVGSQFIQGIGLYPYYSMPLPSKHGTVQRSRFRTGRRRHVHAVDRPPAELPDRLGHQRPRVHARRRRYRAPARATPLADPRRAGFSHPDGTLQEHVCGLVRRLARAAGHRRHHRVLRSAARTRVLHVSRVGRPQHVSEPQRKRARRRRLSHGFDLSSAGVRHERNRDDRSGRRGDPRSRRQ